MSDAAPTLASIAEVENTYTSGAYAKRPLTLVRGQGCTVWDDAGNAYLDATSGIGVAILGHNHPALVRAITQQAETLITCQEMFYNDRRAELYMLLDAITPDGISRFFLCNSGTEAMEGALKVARLLSGRQKIVAAKRAFHGRTLGALALTWNAEYREPFEGWQQPFVTHVGYGDLAAAEGAVTEETAAFVVEAVQGEGGIHPADPAYLQGLRALCDRTGTLLIVDEVQAGIGRTGRWFAFEHADIVPDIMTMGKAVAGGVPMGAVAWRETLGTIPSGVHGSTFGGNPLACAASIATLTTLRDENLVEQAAEKGAWLREALLGLNHRYVREIRGRGLMVGAELRGRVTPVLQSLQGRGVLALNAGKNVLRLLPPLIITQDELEQLVAAIGEALNDAAS